MFFCACPQSKLKQVPPESVAVQFLIPHPRLSCGVYFHVLKNDDAILIRIPPGNVLLRLPSVGIEAESSILPKSDPFSLLSTVYPWSDPFSLPSSASMYSTIHSQPWIIDRAEITVQIKFGRDGMQTKLTDKKTYGNTNINILTLRFSDERKQLSRD